MLRGNPLARLADPLALAGPRGRPRVYLICAAVALLLAAVSLAYPSAPAYDPWAWIIWGRQILHLHLVTAGGPTWKPLPVMFTTLFAPFGGAAPDLWLLVARAGGIMAIALAGVLAFRLVAAPTVDRFAAVLAAALAAGGLALLAGFPEGVALGESEGLIVALLLLAVLRHLDDAPRQAFVLGFGAALIRPEVWPLFVGYGICLWRRDPGSHKRVAWLFALTPALWFLPELWGSGSISRGVQWAQHVRAGSPALAPCPFCAELSAHAWPLTIAPFKLGLACIGPLTVAGLVRRAPLGRGATVVLAAMGLAWIVEEAVLTQIGFSGSDRYLIAPVALLVVAGAAGWGGTVALIRRVLMRRLAPGSAAVCAAALIAVVLAATIPWRGSHLARVAHTASEVRFQATLWRDLRAAISEAGGERRLASCGAIQTNPSEAPLAAWTLGVQLGRTENDDGNVVIQTASGLGAPMVPQPADRRRYQVLARVAMVSILARCQPSDTIGAARAATG